MWMRRSTAGHGHGAKVSKHLVRPIKTKTEPLFEAQRLSSVEQCWCCPALVSVGEEVTGTHGVPCGTPTAFCRFYTLGRTACQGRVSRGHMHVTMAFHTLRRWRDRPPCALRMRSNMMQRVWVYPYHPYHRPCLLWSPHCSLGEGRIVVSWVVQHCSHDGIFR